MNKYNNTIAKVETIKGFHSKICSKMQEIAKELGVKPSRALKNMHTGMSLKQMKKESFPLADSVFIMEMGIKLELKYMDLENHAHDSSVPSHALEAKFEQEMTRWKRDISIGEMDEYLEASGWIRTKVPVNKVTAAWRKLTAPDKKEHH